MIISKKRMVNKELLEIKKANDISSDFELYLQQKIDQVTMSGNPELLNLKFTYNNETFLDLNLPIIPFVYNEREEKYLDVMVRTGDPQLVRDIYDDVKKNSKTDKFTECINLQAYTLNNFVRHEIAGAYIKAVNKKDMNLANHISTLDIMNDVILTPEIIAQKTSYKSKSMMLYPSGKNEFALFLQPKNPPANYNGKDMLEDDDKDYWSYKETLYPLQIKALSDYEKAKSFDSPNIYSEEEIQQYFN